MAGKKVQVQMIKHRKYKSCTRYAVKEKEAYEVWERIYVQNEAYEKLGKPDVIRVTIEAVSLQADAGS